MTFEVTATSSSGMGTTWQSETPHLPSISCAIPPEFMGPGGGFSPEDLFAMAVLNCVIATFKVYVEKAKASFAEVRGKASLKVDRLPDGLSMTHIDLFLDITGASDVEKVKKLMDNAIRDCAVSRSIKSGKTFHVNVS